MTALERASVELADAVVSPSAYLVDWMQRQGWKLPAQTFVIPHVSRAGATGTAPARRASGHEPGEPSRVLRAARGAQGRAPLRGGAEHARAGAARASRRRVSRPVHACLAGRARQRASSRSEPPARFAASSSSRPSTSTRCSTASGARGRSPSCPRSRRTRPTRSTSAWRTGSLSLQAPPPGFVSSSRRRITRGCSSTRPRTGSHEALRGVLRDAETSWAPPAPATTTRESLRRWQEVLALAPRQGSLAVRRLQSLSSSSSTALRLPRSSGAWLLWPAKAGPRTRDGRPGRRRRGEPGAPSDRDARRPIRRAPCRKQSARQHSPSLEGEWVVFLDEGDVAEPALVETLVRAQTASGADVVSCGLFLDSTSEPKKIHLFLGEPRALGLLANGYGHRLPPGARCSSSPRGPLPVTAQKTPLTRIGRCCATELGRSQDRLDSDPAGDSYGPPGSA